MIIRLALVVSAVQCAPYVDLKYDDMVDKMYELSENVPEFARVYSANAKYKIPAASGLCGMRRRSCEQHVIEISDFTKEDARRPEVFISGALHGDERVGPIASIATARLLVYGASCAVQGSKSKCAMLTRGERKSIEGIEDWLLYLVKHRLIVLAPATNAVGFAKGQRTENGIDPNRDFPIDTRPEACMHSVTAQIINELFRDHAFQIAITFHGGMRAIAYEWGAPSYNNNKQHYYHPKKALSSLGRQQQNRRQRNNKAPPAVDRKRRKLVQNSRVSPDDNSQRAVSRALARAAGSFGRVPRYRYASMNEIVYPVHGGMEDWAYAGSWNERIQLKSGCISNTYPSHRTTQYPNASLRTFMILVETSDLKSGPMTDFGGDQDIFNLKSSENGHVPRNLRLALAVIDLVQPYIYWVPSASSPSTVAFAIGGGLTVDEARLAWTCADDINNLKYMTVAQNKAARWGLDDANTLFTPHAALFQASIPSHCPGLKLYAQARLDQEWAIAPPTASPPETPPQTHLANARTNPTWHHQIDGQHQVHGQLWWQSEEPFPYHHRLLYDHEPPSLRRDTTHALDDHAAMVAPAAALALSAAAALGSRYATKHAGIRLFSSSSSSAPVSADEDHDTTSSSVDTTGGRHRRLRQHLRSAAPISV